MSRTILEIRSVAKFFEDKKVLKDISLNVNEGDVIAIVGYSGSGKSTFLRCINLLEEPDRGELIFDGKPYFLVNKCREDFVDFVRYKEDVDVFDKKIDVLKDEYELLLSKKRSKSITALEKQKLKALKKDYRQLENHKPNIYSYFRKKEYRDYCKNTKTFVASEAKLDYIRSKMVMVFQNFNLFDNMDVLANCVFPLVHVKGIAKEDATKIALEKLELVNMSSHLNAKPKTLSGGQKQRVAIARALCMDPSIILFDEPTSALDPQMVFEVLEVMKNLASKGMTMIVVTHEMNFAKNVANKVMYMDDGYVVECLPSSEFFSNPKQQKTKKFLSMN